MIGRITAAELQARLTGGAGGPTLLDVREPDEYALCHIEGSVHIPMSDVAQQLDNLDQDAEIVVICHHGMRSFQVARMLAHYGFSRVNNLDGGIDAWAVDVDPSMARY